MRFTREEEFDLPISAATCPFCEQSVTVDSMGVVASLWFHEWDCSALIPDYELAPEPIEVELPLEQEEAERLPLAA